MRFALIATSAAAVVAVPFALAAAGPQMSSDEFLSAVRCAAYEDVSGAQIADARYELNAESQRQAATTVAEAQETGGGGRRRAGYDRGFALSDHADWPGLLSAIGATGAQRVIVTHGNVPVMLRYLSAQGLQAEAFETQYGDEHGDDPQTATEAAA